MRIVPHLPMDGPVLFIGICGLVSGLFNAVVMAIFSYLYWDVVPDSLQGRFQSMSKNATLIAGLVWSFFIFGLADHHMKGVYVGTATFCLVIYLVSVWQIKEGDYPPPDVHHKGGAMAPIRAYFVECFSQPFFLWIFTGSLMAQLANAGNNYQFWYLRDDLHLNLATIGWTQGWSKAVTTGFGLVCGFYLGSLTDRLKPVRLMAPLYAVMALINFGSFFYIHDKWTCLFAACVLNMVLFFLGVVVGAFTVEVFPREKLGQFCSAQAVFYQFLLTLIGPFIGMFYDRIHFNRLAYLWTSLFQLVAGFVYLKVYFNWKIKKGQTPVPHAG